MYKSLQIDNFRGLRHLELPVLAPVTILTGRNNAGKTSILEALFLHSAGPRAAQALLTILRPYRLSGALNVEFSRFSTPWEMAFYNRDPSESIRIVGEWDGQQVAVGLTVPRDRASGSVVPSLQSAAASSTSSTSTLSALPSFSYSMRITIDVESRQSPAPEHREFIQTISAQLGQALLGPSGIQQVGGVSLELKPETDSDALVLAYFLGPQSRSPQAELVQRYTNIRLDGKERLFLHAMQAIAPEMRKIEILSTGTPTLYVTFRDGPPLPMTVMGEGIVAVANYAAAILENKGGVILIDEVENGIHYTALERVWQQIGRAVKDSGAQVIASTHSYECVQAAYSAFRKSPNQLQLIQLQSDDDSPAATVAADYDLETLEGALEMRLDLR
jgi:putative AbiEii toxin of type IV toxin-antitoxin system